MHWCSSCPFRTRHCSDNPSSTRVAKEGVTAKNAPRIVCPQNRAKCPGQSNTLRARIDWPALSLRGLGRAVGTAVAASFSAGIRTMRFGSRNPRGSGACLPSRDRRVWCARIPSVRCLPGRKFARFNASYNFGAVTAAALPLPLVATLGLWVEQRLLRGRFFQFGWRVRQVDGCVALRLWRTPLCAVATLNALTLVISSSGISSIHRSRRDADRSRKACWRPLLRRQVHRRRPSSCGRRTQESSLLLRPRAEWFTSTRCPPSFVNAPPRQTERFSRSELVAEYSSTGPIAASHSSGSCIRSTADAIRFRLCRRDKDCARKVTLGDLRPAE